MTTVRIDVAARVGEGHGPVSRAEARVLAAVIPVTGRVELDFAGIERIGPSFADELFRVFANAHPDVLLAPVNMTEEVSNMMRRAEANTTEGELR